MRAQGTGVLSIPISAAVKARLREMASKDSRTLADFVRVKLSALVLRSNAAHRAAERARENDRIRKAAA